MNWKLFAVCAVLAFGSGCDKIKQVFEKEPEVEAIPATGPRLLSVRADGEKYIAWKAEGIGHWKNVAKRGNINAWIVVNGVECENIREGYDRQHLNNAYGAAGDHGVPGIKTGDKVQIKLRKLDGSEETNPVEFTWPWKPTRGG